MLARYEEYEQLSPPTKAKTQRPTFDHPPLSREEASAWKHSLWQAWIEHRRTKRPVPPPGTLGYPRGWLKNKDEIVLGSVQTVWWQKPDERVTVTMRYGARTVGTKPQKGWPVFINLHGGGNNPQMNDIGWASTMRQYPVQQGLYICPRSPVDTVGSWNDPQSIAALERLIAELPTTWEIDPDRVYLMGFSMGAIGVLHIGSSLPDRWAAVAASSGFTYLNARGRAAHQNLLNLPTMVQIGTKDLDFNRSRRCGPTRRSRPRYPTKSRPRPRRPPSCSMPSRSRSATRKPPRGAPHGPWS